MYRGFESICNFNNTILTKCTDYSTIHAKFFDSKTLHQKSLYSNHVNKTIPEYLRLFLS